MADNIYAAPESDVATPTDIDVKTASRRRRFFAVLVDSLIIGIATLPLMYFTGGFSGFSTGVQPSFLYTISIGLVGIVVYFVVNTRSLIANGQTIGKKALGIKITDMDGNVPTFKQHLFKRYGLSMVVPQIPILGSVIGIVDILFILGKQKRCLHDRFAETQVLVE